MLACGDATGKHVHMCMQSSSQVAPEEAIKTVQMVLAPSQGRPLPPVHLENVSLGLLLPPPQVCQGPPVLKQYSNLPGWLSA